jgi:hypothetical protein
MSVAAVWTRARRREARSEAAVGAHPSREADGAAAFTCVDCGGAIAEVLASLGSLCCHDCRSGGRSDRRL